LIAQKPMQTTLHGPGTARLQTVELGLMNDEQAEIRSGLTEGELVVLAPESSLIDGMRVEASGR
jgi:HlyD family secretion protein